MIIKCKRCKDDFKVSSLKSKFCDFCKITKKCERDKKYKAITRIHKNIKCKFCGIKFTQTYGRNYCSRKCSKDKFFIPRLIKKRENTILRKMNELRLLKEKYVHLL